MASSGGDAGGSDGDKAPEKAEEKKKRDKTKDVATAILERKKAPNRLVVGACESGSRRNHHSSSSIAQKSLLLLLNRRRKTFLSLAAQSASAAFEESSFDDVSFVRLSVGGGRSRSKGSSTPYRALALVASRLASLGHDDDDASAGTSF